MSRADTAIRAAAGVTVVGLAGIAAAISYSHMTELAHAHGETGWRAHMFPLSVDGIEIVASLVLLADKRAVAVRVTKETLDSETMEFNSVTLFTKGVPEPLRKTRERAASRTAAGRW